MKVPFETYIEQVVDGTQYKGHILIGKAKLDYKLTFAVPIPQLDDMPEIEGPDAVRRIFQITLKRDGNAIELTSEEYSLFFQMIVEFAVDFYNNPQTRSSNEGRMGEMLKSMGPLAAYDASMSIGITSKGSCDFPPAVCEMLNKQKFGCALIG
jgi:hypothetical protein